MPDEQSPQNNAEGAEAPASPQVVSSPLSMLARRVGEFRRDPRVAIESVSPMTLALWGTLQDDPETVATRHAATLRTLQDASARADAPDDPTERGPRRTAPGSAVNALQAIADAMTVKAMSGDAQAAAAIADRIEGKPGNRIGDVDPDAEARRDEVRRTIESVVRHMASQVITVEPVSVEVTTKSKTSNE